MSLVLSVAPHPLLELAVFTVTLPAPLAELPSPHALQGGLRLDAPAPLAADDAVRAAVREVLRRGGFKPTGRSKPASEYLRKASEEGVLGPINLAVDACNVVSLHSGLPISVVDLDRTRPPLRIETAASDAAYVFNASGQSIDLGGLVCLHDAEGPCANAVKDAQRTKTAPDTRRLLVLVWGAAALPGRAARAAEWYRALLAPTGAAFAEVERGPQ